MRQEEKAGVAVGQLIGRRMLKGLKVVACAVALYAAGNAQAQNLFEWGADPVTGPSPSVAGYTPAPFLRNPGTAVGSYLSGLPAGSVKAVKIDYQDLTPGTISAVYGANNVNYSFADYETGNVLARVTALRNQIAGSTGTGPALLANTSYVGNFDLAPLTADTTRPGGIAPLGFAEFQSSGVNMANESLYPGSGSFRSTALSGAAGSSAPNLRSSLFTLPITRMSLVAGNVAPGQKHVPYITRFNNASGGISNGTANGQPAFFFDAAHGTAGQLLSRGDYSALVAHVRARGADGVHVLDNGVVGYTQAQVAQDTADGWHFAPFENIFNGGGARSASLDTMIKVDGSSKTLEDAGVVMSGVYSLTQNGGAGHLALLVSNLDDAPHDLSIPQKIGGKSIAGVFNVLGGQHKLLDFTGGAGAQWVLTNPGGTVVFADSNRDGVGVPEPTMIGGLALFACLGLVRRRKA